MKNASFTVKGDQMVITVNLRGSEDLGTTEKGNKKIAGTSPSWEKVPGTNFKFTLAVIETAPKQKKLSKDEQLIQLQEQVAKLTALLTQGK